MEAETNHLSEISFDGITAPLVVYTLWRHVKVMKVSFKPENGMLNSVFFLYSSSK